MTENLLKKEVDPGFLGLSSSPVGVGVGTAGANDGGVVGGVKFVSISKIWSGSGKSGSDSGGMFSGIPGKAGGKCTVEKAGFETPMGGGGSSFVGEMVNCSSPDSGSSFNLKIVLGEDEGGNKGGVPRAGDGGDGGVEASRKTVFFPEVRGAVGDTGPGDGGVVR